MKNVRKPTRRIHESILPILTAFLIGLGCSSMDRQPRNVILFIGDGMGVCHVTAAKTVAGRLAMERFKTAGFYTTHSSDRYVTDSAASATALATGEKTYNGAISVSPDTTMLKTVLEYAEDLGKSTGLVATASVTHATPAAFASHVDTRRNQTTIAEHLLSSGVDVLFGGGLGYFLPSTDSRSLREDAANLIARFGETHRVDTTIASFRAIDETGRAVALLASGHLPPVHERIVPLAEMTQRAVSILSKNKAGFFLMVEGSQIDWEGHDNNTQGIVQETLDFDKAVAAGLDFAEAEGRTLVLVTADHETGGFALENGSLTEHTIVGDFTTGSHTGTMVPLFAFGPGSARFGGIHDNTFIGQTLIEFFQK